MAINKNAPLTPLGREELCRRVIVEGHVPRGRDNGVWMCMRAGRKFRLLTIIDEFTRECLAIEVARRLRSDDVLHRLAELFSERGPPDHIRSDNGSEFSAKAVKA